MDSWVCSECGYKSSAYDSISAEYCAYGLAGYEAWKKHMEDGRTSRWVQVPEHIIRRIQAKLDRNIDLTPDEHSFTHRTKMVKR